MMHDPVRGQELWGETTTWGGVDRRRFCAPFMGADRRPRRPAQTLARAIPAADGRELRGHLGRRRRRRTAVQICLVAAMVVINNMVFEFSNAFHGAMLSGIAPLSSIGGLSGLAYALGNGVGRAAAGFLSSSPSWLPGTGGCRLHSGSSAIGRQPGGARAANGCPVPISARLDAAARHPAVSLHARPGPGTAVLREADRQGVAALIRHRHEPASITATSRITLARARSSTTA